MHFSGLASSFFSRKNLCFFLEKTTLKKIICSKKSFSYILEMELSSLKIKKFLIFSQKKDFLMFRKMEFSSSKLKRLLVFQEGILRALQINKKCHEKKVCIFWEMKLFSSKLKKLLYSSLTFLISYISFIFYLIYTCKASKTIS